ncbi:MAG: nucleoid occlusion protein [Firmicutes bacterium]|nr:nucleoid occlusion protein [Bacillota bacterium]
MKSEVWQEQVQNLPVELIKPSKYQPRSDFDEKALNELAQSISEHGVLHPVIVRKANIGYELIVGERRLRACKLLGWDSIPAIVRDMTDKAAAELALIENLQRKDLQLFEEAEGYQRLLDEFELTQEELAKRLGKSQSSIANKIRLLKLPDSVREIISREMLSERHSRCMLRLKSEADQLEILEKVIKNDLNVRETEELVRRFLEKGSESGEQDRSGQQRKLIVKDVRLFTNSVRQLADSLKMSGLEVDFQEREHQDCYELLVVVKKPQRGE